MGIDFVESDVAPNPRVRVKLSNPFEGAFPVPEGKFRRATFPVTRVPERVVRKGKNRGETVADAYIMVGDRECTIDVATKLAQSAGREAGATTRVHVEYGEGSVTMTFSSVYEDGKPHIVERKRKS